MRYMLYDSAGESIGLQQEIEHLHNYMDLMLLKYRHDDPPDVDFQVDGITPNLRVAPLILLPFVENAFKHGLDNKGEGSIRIKILAQNDRVDFSVTNSHFPDRTASETHKGIGLENVKRRLEHHFPDRHELEIKISEDEYQVRLRISL